MSPKNLIILFLIAVFMVFFLQNSGPLRITVLFETLTISKLTLLPGLALCGFVAGYLLGRSGRQRSRRLEKERLEKPSGGLGPEDEDYLNY